jgi:hypothetical protein
MAGSLTPGKDFVNRPPTGKGEEPEIRPLPPIPPFHQGMGEAGPTRADRVADAPAALDPSGGRQTPEIHPPLAAAYFSATTSQFTTFQKAAR